jgi:hypothetical protein
VIDYERVLGEIVKSISSQKGRIKTLTPGCQKSFLK